MDWDDYKGRRKALEIERTRARNLLDKHAARWALGARVEEDSALIKKLRGELKDVLDREETLEGEFWAEFVERYYAQGS